jgi:hypothetical protein
VVGVEIDKCSAYNSVVAGKSLLSIRSLTNRNTLIFDILYCYYFFLATVFFFLSLIVEFQQQNWHQHSHLPCCFYFYIYFYLASVQLSYYIYTFQHNYKRKYKYMPNRWMHTSYCNFKKKKLNRVKNKIKYYANKKCQIKKKMTVYKYIYTIT